MKTKFLLPNRVKKIGWWLFFPALVLASIQFFGEVEPGFLEFEVIQLLSVDWVFTAESKQVFKLIYFNENNIADELVSTLLLVSCMLLVFSRERDEDEFVMRLRLESILLVNLINGLVLLFSIVFFYDLTFFYVMVINLFLLFIIFIIRFHWVLRKYRREAE